MLEHPKAAIDRDRKRRGKKALAIQLRLCFLARLGSNLMLKEKKEVGRAHTKKNYRHLYVAQESKDNK